MYVVAGRMRDNQLRGMWKTLGMENRGKKRTWWNEENRNYGEMGWKRWEKVKN